LRPCRKTARGRNRDRADKPLDAVLRRRSKAPANQTPQLLRHPPTPPSLFGRRVLD
jgi:hypothetical protein